jgi:transcriptional regulator with XRE-family HTH domain
MTRHSPAALALMAEGDTLTELAAALGVTRQAVSQQLAGKRAGSLRPKLETAIAERIGPDKAAAVIDLARIAGDEDGAA